MPVKEVIKIVEVNTPSDIAEPPGDNSFISTDLIELKARVKDSDLQEKITWEVKGIDKKSGTGLPVTGLGSRFIFYPLPEPHPIYKKGTTKCDVPGPGSCEKAKPLGYNVTASVEKDSTVYSDDVLPLPPLIQDERDTMRQEYVNHGIAVPERGEFVDKKTATTTHFRPNEYNQTAYDFVIFGRMGEAAEGTREEYNRILKEKLEAKDKTIKIPPEGYGIKMNSGYRNPERQEVFGSAKGSYHQYGDALDLAPVNNVPGFTLSELFGILQQAADPFAGYTQCEQDGLKVEPCAYTNPKMEPDHVHIQQLR